MVRPAVKKEISVCERSMIVIVPHQPIHFYFIFSVDGRGIFSCRTGRTHRRHQKNAQVQDVLLLYRKVGLKQYLNVDRAKQLTIYKIQLSMLYQVVWKRIEELH